VFFKNNKMNKSSIDYLSVLIVMMIFFVISFITNIIGPLVPDFIQSFDLSFVLASFLPLSFFIAYGLFSIPSGIILEKTGNKQMIFFAFALSFVGALIIIIFKTYTSLLFSFFLIGTGMAILQVVINPLLRESVSPQNFAFFSVVGQLVFGFASFLSPIFYKSIVQSSEVKAYSFFADSPWVLIYLSFLLLLALVSVIVYLVKLPSITFIEGEKFKFGSTFYDFLRERNSYIFFFGIFCYVGVEQGINNWVSQFLYQYHGLDPNVVGTEVISAFWGNLTVGTLVALILIKTVDGKVLLHIYSLASSVLILCALFGSLEVSVLSFKLMGFSISGIWSLVISLGLNSVTKNHGTFTGILLTGIIGGAIFPFLIAFISQISELRYGMLLIFLGLLYISYIGFYSKPIEKNSLLKF
tara:strand:- start:575 stop:1810 length:1236 start_codon:yes stop_codon:yes gene_type:complete